MAFNIMAAAIVKGTRYRQNRRVQEPKKKPVFIEYDKKAAKKKMDRLAAIRSAAIKNGLM